MWSEIIFPCSLYSDRERKESQLHATAVYSQGKVPLRVSWHPEPNWKQRKGKKYIYIFFFFSLSTSAISLLILYQLGYYGFTRIHNCELTWFMWSDSILKWSDWSEVRWVTVKFLWIKVLCTLGWLCTAGIWLYCDHFIWVYLALCLF
jgi:hypothetical protein